MGQKDIATKNLLRCKDVFADVMNATLFDGKAIIRPEELIEINTVSNAIYPVDGKAHEQLRDVAFRSVKNGITMRLLGCENQTSIIDYMPMRIIAYDGVAYGEQANRIAKGEKFQPYPVITIVLNYSSQPWNKPKSIHEMLGIKSDDLLATVVSDYRIIVLDVRFLTEKQVYSFKSDFGLIARIFADNCEGIQQLGAIQHPLEVAKVVKAFESDAKFKEGLNHMKSLTLAEFFKLYYDNEVKELRQEVAETAITNLMGAMKCGREQAISILFPDGAGDFDVSSTRPPSASMREMNL